MKVVLFGATGMVGQGVLRECLLDPDVEGVVGVVRNSSLPQHDKLREIVHQDVSDLSPIEHRLSGYDTAPPLPAQQPIPAPTFRVQSSLVLVDVITHDRRSGLPIRDFKRGDFRVFDNGHEVPITTFDVGVQYDTRAITLWLVVICNEAGPPKLGASAEFLGQESLFRPALDHLESNDRVGVAHWCDNGDTELDLLPTKERDNAIRKLAETLKPIPFEGGTSASDEAGEQAFRKLIRFIIRDAYSRNPKTLPVIVFLHGDHTGQPHGELNKLVDDFLETSGIVFGIRDARSPNLRFLIGEQAKIMHYMAKYTGGRVFLCPSLRV